MGYSAAIRAVRLDPRSLDPVKGVTCGLPSRSALDLVSRLRSCVQPRLWLGRTLQGSCATLPRSDKIDCVATVSRELLFPLPLQSVKGCQDVLLCSLVLHYESMNSRSLETIVRPGRRSVIYVSIDFRFKHEAHANVEGGPLEVDRNVGNLSLYNQQRRIE